MDDDDPYSDLDWRDPQHCACCGAWMDPEWVSEFGVCADCEGVLVWERLHAQIEQQRRAALREGE